MKILESILKNINKMVTAKGFNPAILLMNRSKPSRENLLDSDRKSSESNRNCGIIGVSPLLDKKVDNSTSSQSKSHNSGISIKALISGFSIIIRMMVLGLTVYGWSIVWSYLYDNNIENKYHLSALLFLLTISIINQLIRSFFPIVKLFSVVESPEFIDWNKPLANRAWLNRTKLVLGIALLCLVVSNWHSVAFIAKTKPLLFVALTILIISMFWLITPYRLNLSAVRKLLGLHLKLHPDFVHKYVTSNLGVSLKYIGTVCFMVYHYFAINNATYLLENYLTSIGVQILALLSLVWIYQVLALNFISLQYIIHKLYICYFVEKLDVSSMPYPIDVALDKYLVSAESRVCNQNVVNYSNLSSSSSSSHSSSSSLSSSPSPSPSSSTGLSSSSSSSSEEVIELESGSSIIAEKQESDKLLVWRDRIFEAEDKLLSAVSEFITPKTTMLTGELAIRLATKDTQFVSKNGVIFNNTLDRASWTLKFVLVVVIAAVFALFAFMTDLTSLSQSQSESQFESGSGSQSQSMEEVVEKDIDTAMEDKDIRNPLKSVLFEELDNRLLSSSYPVLEKVDNLSFATFNDESIIINKAVSFNESPENVRKLVAQLNVSKHYFWTSVQVADLNTCMHALHGRILLDDDKLTSVLNSHIDSWSHATNLQEVVHGFIGVYNTIADLIMSISDTDRAISSNALGRLSPEATPYINIVETRETVISDGWIYRASDTYTHVYGYSRLYPKSPPSELWILVFSWMAYQTLDIYIGRL